MLTINFKNMEPKIKERIQYGSALVTLASGIIICFIALFMSDDNDVPNGALWYFGQTLVYAATICGFKLMIDNPKK